MILTPQQVRQILTNPEVSPGQDEAIRQQERIVLHGRPAVKNEPKANRVSSPALRSLVDYLRRMLPRDKYRTVLGLIRFPLDTVTLAGECYAQMERAFEGVDRSEQYQFSAENAGADWSAYREQMGGLSSWRSWCMATLRCSPNCVVVVDLPEAIGADRAAPYFYRLELSDLHAYQVKGQAGFEYAAWRIATEQGQPERFVVIDEAAYHVYEKSEGGDFVEVARNAHDLGYCPARMFWTDVIDPAKPVIRAHPFSEFLGKMDWLQVSYWLKRFGDLFNGFPIVSTYKQDCTFKDEVRECREGYLYDLERATYYLDDDGGFEPCPACRDRLNVGPGTHYEVPLPGAGNGNTSMIPAVGVTRVDRDSLDYNRENIAEQERAIYTGIVGSTYDGLENSQAINEQQVQSIFEARRNLLVKVARNFEALQTWVESTMCRLRYGSGFKSASINYGTEFFLFSADEVLSLYLAARTGQAPASTLDYLHDLYLQTRHRHQPEELKRARMIADLDPARHHTAESAMVLFQSGILTRQQYAYKLNEASMIADFERDNGPLTAYREKENYPQRIESIRAELYGMVPDAETQTQSANPQPAQPRGLVAA